MPSPENIAILDAHLANLTPDRLPNYDGPVPREAVHSAVMPLVRELSLVRVVEGIIQQRTIDHEAAKLKSEIEGAARILDAVAPFVMMHLELRPDLYVNRASNDGLWSRADEEIRWAEWIEDRAYQLADATLKPA